MSQINTSVELLLKIRQQGLEQAKQAEEAINSLAAAQRAGSASNAAAVQKEAAATAGLLTLVKGLAASYLGLNIARRAVAESRGGELVEQRVLGVLTAQLKSRQQAVVETERLKRLSKEIFDDLRVFDDDTILSGLGAGITVAPQLLGREDRFARASADLAVALFDSDFNTAAEGLAKTLEGVPGILQKAIPELRKIADDLGPERFERFLREGGAIGLVEERFGGAAAAFADSRLGAEAEAAARFNNALEDVGDALRTGILPFLEGVSYILRRLERYANQDANSVVLDRILERVDKLPLNEQIDAIRAEREALYRERDANRPPPPQDPREVAESVILGSLSGLGAFNLAAAALEEAKRSGALQNLAAAAAGGPAGLAGGLAVSAYRAAGGPLPADSTEFDKIMTALDVRIEEIQNLLNNEQGFALAPFVLKPEQRTALIGDLGLIDGLTARINALKADFTAIDPTFDPPPGFLITKEEANTETEYFYNLAVARETAIELTTKLKERQEALNRAIQRANDLAEAGEISNAKRFAIIQQEAAGLRDFLKGLGLSESDIAEFAAQQVQAIEALSGIDLPDTPEFIEKFREQLKLAREDIEDLATTVTSLSDELRTRLEDPFAGLIDKAAQGEASLADFADTFIATFRRLISERLSETLLDGLLGGRGGGSGGSGLFGGIFDLFGGLLGFDEGGVVPGPDLGRDSRVIAVRGLEHIQPPEVVRQPGMLQHLEDIRHGRWRPGVGHYTGMPSSGASYARSSRGAGYASGGLVDVTERFAASTRGGSGGGRVLALPVALVDRELSERVHSGRNAIAASDAMAREPTRYRAAIGENNIDGLGRRT